MGENSAREDIFEEEFCVLQSIYGDEIKREDILNHTILRIQLHPATAENVNSQFVYTDVEIKVDRDYPNTSPEVKIPSSRGLSDKGAVALVKELDEFSAGRIGDMVIFDLIELIKEKLTNNNIPWHPCSICLNQFHKCDGIYKTQCYHYFHVYCMKNYVEHELIETVSSDPVFLCPTCRNKINVEVSSLTNAKKPVYEEEPDSADVAEFHNMWKKHVSVYERQKQNGGIIDLEEEKNKNLLSNIEKKFAETQLQKTKSESGEASSSAKEDKPFTHGNGLITHRDNKLPRHQRYNNTVRTTTHQSRYDHHGKRTSNNGYSDCGNSYSNHHIDRHRYHKHWNNKNKKFHHRKKTGGNNSPKDSTLATTRADKQQNNLIKKTAMDYNNKSKMAGD